MALSDKLTAIADAIRGKTGKTDGLTLDQMATEIAGIQAGGSGSADELTLLLGDQLTSYTNNTITALREEAFSCAQNLVELHLPSVTSIGPYAFSRTGAKELVFPNIVSVGANAFRETRCEKVDLPAARSIGLACFVDSTALKVLILRSDTLCALGNSNAFLRTPMASGGSGGTIYVPAALIESYTNATNWSTIFAGGAVTFAAVEGSEYE